MLKFYDVNKTSTREVTSESDTSLSGLSASLLLEGQPVAFASKVLTSAESRYARIEKELLSVVFACERFDTYPYGRDVVRVKTDHQPLEAILRRTPAVRLQRYNLDVPSTKKEG